MKSYLSRKEAAQYVTDKGLPVSPNTFQKYATTGGGPEYEIFGNRAVYQPEKLDAWIGQKLTSPHSSAA